VIKITPTKKKYEPPGWGGHPDGSYVYYKGEPKRVIGLLNKICGGNHGIYKPMGSLATDWFNKFP
jgi:hypothetical protein